MGDKSAISWTNATWNPTVGCTRVSEGCDHCYAFALHDQRHIAWKNGRMQSAAPQYHLPFSRIQLLRDRLDAPLRWRKPRRIFVNSMSDLFHEAIPWEFTARVFAIMARAQHHTFQVLTKRPERMREWIGSPEFANDVACLAPDLLDGTLFPWPLANVWLGISAENQQRFDERIGDLMDTPAAVRFISAEPLLGPIHLWDSVLTGTHIDSDGMECGAHPSLDWVIVGGESGPHHRPMDLAWASSIREQCRAAGVAYFGKQNSGARPGEALPGALGDQEWPA